MPAYHARISFEAHDKVSNAAIVNVLHAEVDTLTSPPDWTSIATDVNAWLGTLWNNGLSSGAHFDQIVVSDANYPGSTFGQGVHVVSTDGARVPNDTKIDPALCIVASWKTAVAKRYARGHSFLWPADDTSTIAGTGSWNFAAAYYQAAAAFVNGFVAGHTAGSTSYVPEVFSPHRVALGATPFSFKILAGSLSPKQHFLRSRST